MRRDGQATDVHTYKHILHTPFGVRYSAKSLKRFKRLMRVARFGQAKSLTRQGTMRAWYSSAPSNLPIFSMGARTWWPGLRRGMPRDDDEAKHVRWVQQDLFLSDLFCISVGYLYLSKLYLFLTLPLSHTLSRARFPLLTHPLPRANAVLCSPSCCLVPCHSSRSRGAAGCSPTPFYNTLPPSWNPLMLCDLSSLLTRAAVLERL